MKPPKIEPLTNIINIAILLWPSSSNPDIVNSVGIGITEDSKLFMNRPINPSFTKYGLFMNVILPTVIVSWFKEPSVIILTYNTGTQSTQYTKTSR